MRVALASLAFSGTNAFAEPAADEKAVCSRSYEDAQRDQKAGRLVASREAYLRCAAETCPAVVRQECLGALPDVEKAIPTVVFDAVDDAGKQVVEVSIAEGDRAIASQIDGRPVPLDPGPHRFRFTAKDGRSASKEVVLLEGEQRRAVRAALGDAPERDVSQGPETTRPFGPWPWILVGGGIATAGAGVALVAVGSSEVSDAEALCGEDRTCAGNAEAADLGNAGNLKVNVGVGLCIGGGALIVGGVLWQLLGNQAEPVVTPAVSGDFGGLRVRGRFR